MTEGYCSNSKMRIAVITPTFNRPTLLERLHCSLNHQEGAVDWVHIVVDDCSSETSRMATMADQRIEYIRLARNSGPLVARNAGLDRAHALGVTWICFVDDDDFLISRAFETIRRIVHTHPGARFLMFRSGPEDSPLPSGWPHVPKCVSWISDIADGARYTVDNFVVLSTDIVRNARFSQFGRSQREWTFFTKVARTCDEVLICPDLLRIHHYLEGGLTHTTDRNAATLAKVWNIVSRAVVYYSLKPTSLKLGLRVAKQLSLLPLRLAFVMWRKCTQYCSKV